MHILYNFWKIDQYPMNICKQINNIINQTMRECNFQEQGRCTGMYEI